MNTKTNWVPTDNRFVAFFDILGFKEMVMRFSHNEIYSKLSEISKTKKWLEEISIAHNAIEKVGNGEIYTVSFSDSFVIFSKNDDAENFKFFLIAIRWFFAKSIEKNIPLKGGIAHGEISLNKSEQIYFGQPIIDAYLIEEDVNYLGIACHYTIDKYIFENYASLPVDIIDKVIFDCPTPLKSGKINHKNIDWFRMLSILDNIKDKTAKEKTDAIKDVITNFRLTSSGSPRRYVDNTLEVLNLRRP